MPSARDELVDLRAKNYKSRLQLQPVPPPPVICLPSSRSKGMFAANYVRTDALADLYALSLCLFFYPDEGRLNAMCIGEVGRKFLEVRHPRSSLFSPRLTLIAVSSPGPTLPFISPDSLAIIPSPPARVPVTDTTAPMGIPSI